MMYEINSVAINNADAENPFVEMECTNLDECLLNGWDRDFSESVAIFRFPLNTRGARVYLYKIAKSHGKAEAANMNELVSSLVGTITNLSSNFLYKGDE